MQFPGFRWTHVAATGAIAVLAGLLLVRGPWSVGARGNDGAPETSNIAMNCAPGQQAVVRQSVVNRALQVSIDCVTAGPSTTTGYVDPYGRPLTPDTVAAIRGGELIGAPNAYAQRAVLTQPVSQPEYRYAPVRQSAPRPLARQRSWQKTALVIGGSAGAGAGIGALIGGKKGAGIGAAIGGGSAALFEAIKR